MRVLVKDVMSRGVLRLKRDQTVKEVAQLFLDRSIDGAPVVDDTGKVIGVFTKTHLMRAFGKSLDIRIEALMNKNVMSINESMHVEEALNIPVGRLPVVDDNGMMVGWLTRTDLAKAFLNHYQKSIESLSQVIEASPHGMVAFDAKGTIQVFNREAAALAGIDAESAIGRYISEVFPTLDLERVVRSGHPVSLELTINGVIYYVDISPIKTGNQIKGAVAEFCRLKR